MSWLSGLSKRQRVAGGVAGAVALLGVVGMANDEPPAPTPAAVVTERVTETATETVTEMAVEALEVRSERARLNRVKDNLNDRKDELKARNRRLDRREQQLDDRVAAISDTEERADQQSLVDLPADDPEPAAPPPEEPAVEQPATTTSYANCDAARAAGAAPVRRGDPGYGSHLDRDGDGVGCE